MRCQVTVSPRLPASTNHFPVLFLWVQPPPSLVGIRWCRVGWRPNGGPVRVPRHRLGHIAALRVHKLCVAICAPCTVYFSVLLVSVASLGAQHKLTLPSMPRNELPTVYVDCTTVFPTLPLVFPLTRIV